MPGPDAEGSPTIGGGVGLGRRHLFPGLSRGLLHAAAFAWGWEAKEGSGGRCGASRRSGRSRREGDASAVTEQKPGKPRPLRGRSEGSCGARRRRLRNLRGRSSPPPPPALRPAGGTRGSLAAQGRRRRDPAPPGRPAPIAAAGLVTRRVALRARGQRPAAAGVAAGPEQEPGRGRRAEEPT
ncbi:uncharacterized protein LOC111151425 [Enhydra lutris kenyoni]|uniref:Uncharacterized protein LOC111151425 n=1 Tax=Enhydra lutris kenyoni TaxID=391180 RepID=A0A2Y9JWC0_ENHLU|nr:uncharacterized protein LOC111151425 [Enhydra lutris kenyoni]